MGVLLSVVVPVYNGEKFLSKCLDSLQRAIALLTPEERDRLELVVCDNCSTDHTQQLAELFTFPCSYRVIQTPQHYDNRTENWRYGLGQLAGTWIMMLHADDLMAEEGLQSIFRACAWVDDRPAAMLTGRIRTFTDQTPPGRVKPYWGLPNWIGGESLRRHVLPYICPFVPFCVMRQSAYRAVGGLDPQYELVQDWDLWLRLLSHGALYAFPEVFGLWRTHGFSEKYSQIFAREHWAIAKN
ncbi:MAG: glycosyltransferase [Oscillatoriales cyanobacterium SM2_2_1]|nr:glycosyltransferase [Oscillatoriales cyanobacterium SM2_2_1]